MRKLASTLIVVVLLLGTAIGIDETRAQADSAADHLPQMLPLPHAACFRVDGQGVLDGPALIERLAAAPGTDADVRSLGWIDGAYRQYGCDVPPAGSAGWIEVNVHRFGDAASAAAAVPLFAHARAAGTSLEPAPSPIDLGEQSAALSGPASNGTEYTLYLSSGPLLFRVTGVAPVGSPALDVEQVMTGLVLGREAAAIHQIRPGSVTVASGAEVPSYPTSTQPAYVILDLGTGQGNASLARSINDRGQVLWVWGTTRDPMSGVFIDAHQVVSWNAMTTDLTALGMRFAIEVNDLGIVLGSNADRGVVYWPDAGTVEMLPGFERDAYPAGINTFGVVTGNVEGRPVIGDGSRLLEMPLPLEYGFLEPAAINDTGDVAGTVRVSRTDDSVQRAVLYVDGILTVLDAAPGAASSRAVDLNEAGQLVGGPGVRGMHAIQEPGRAFLYDHGTGTTVDIGTLPGYQHSAASAINDEGQVVGHALVPDNARNPNRSAFLFDHRTGEIIDLNLLIPAGSGWQLYDAFDINNVGQIVGQGMIDGAMHGFVLTPVR